MFFSKKLQKFENIKHCFFSRKDGFSKGDYESLNCGLGSGDKKENVLKNLESVSKKIGCKKESLITLNQKHTNEVICFNSDSDVKNKLTGDAIVSKVKNIGISILTADCASIFFYDPKNKIVGCSHAGWKGALNGIIKNTVEKFNEVFIGKLKLKMPEIVYVYSQNSAISFLNLIKNYQLVDHWMDTNLMCIGEKTSMVLNEIKWKKIFLFNPGEEEFLLYKI